MDRLENINIIMLMGIAIATAVWYIRMVDNYSGRLLSIRPKIKYFRAVSVALIFIVSCVAIFINLPLIVIYIIVFGFFVTMFYVSSDSGIMAVVLSSIIFTLHICLANLIVSVGVGIIANTTIYHIHENPLMDVLNIILSFVLMIFILGMFEKAVAAEDIRLLFKSRLHLKYTLRFGIFSLVYVLLDALIGSLPEYCRSLNAYLLVSPLASVLLFGLFLMHNIRIVKASEYESRYKNLRRCEQEHEELERKLEEMVFRDFLTGSYTRNYVEDLYKRNELGESFVIAYIDLDSLKNVNDLKGHVVGDAYLKDVATALMGNIRSEDKLVRMGGDEFIVIFHSCSSADARRIMERVRNIIKDFETEIGTPVGISYGIADSGSANSFEEIIKLADARMYEYKKINKTGGGNASDGKYGPGGGGANGIVSEI